MSYPACQRVLDGHPERKTALVRQIHISASALSAGHLPAEHVVDEIVGCMRPVVAASTKEN